MKKIKKNTTKVKVSWTWELEHNLAKVSKQGPIFSSKEEAKRVLRRSSNFVENKDGVLIPMYSIRYIKILPEGLSDVINTIKVTDKQQEDEIFKQALGERLGMDK